MLTNSHFAVLYTFEELSAPKGNLYSVFLSLLGVHVFFSKVELNVDIEWWKDYQVPREGNSFCISVFERGDYVDLQGFKDQKVL